MSKKKNNNSRSFSFTKPILYNGALYPSVEADISYADGSTQRGAVFTDDKGQYFTLNGNGSAVPVMTLNSLPEVTITPSLADAVSQSASNSRILSNDNTIISSSTPRAYNPHLSSSAIRGAKAHASWEQAHPNLSSWSYAAAAAPFAVAAAPLIGAAGQALAGTSLGQSVISGVNAAMANPVVNTVNNGLGLGFGAKGIYDVGRGIFTPGTALDLMGLPFGIKYELSAADRFLNGSKRARRTLPSAPEYSSAPVAAPSPQSIEGSASLALPSRSMSVQLPNPQYSPASSTLRGLDSDVDAYVDSFFSHTPSSSRTVLPAPPQEVILPSLPEAAPALSRTAMPYSPGEVPADAYNPFRGMTTAEIDARQQRAIQDIINRSYNEQEAAANAQDALNIGREDTFGWDAYPSPEEPAIPTGYASRSANASSSVTGNPIISFRARDTRKGELPYTDEEINALINPDGTLKEGVIPMDFVDTGSHGDLYKAYNSPKDVLTKHLAMTNPANSRGTANQLQQIMNANPTGRSGIIVNTHTLDTSIDSTPLAYMMAMRLGKKFKPLAGAVDGYSHAIPRNFRQGFADHGRVMSNSFGYNNIFKESPAVADRARTLLAKNPDAEVNLVKDANGNMTAFELSDENGTFLIPLRSRDEVLDKMNKRLKAFNNRFGTSYKDIRPFRSAISTHVWDPNNPYPWYFGEQFNLPNIYGISYKKGGKLKKKKCLTF